MAGRRAGRGNRHANRVRHSLYGGSEQIGQATRLPLGGAPVTVGERVPAALRARVETMRQVPDRQRDLIWVQDGPRLIPVPTGEGEAPRTVDLGSWPGFAEPGLGSAVFAPGGTALAYTYSFGEGSHLFVVNNLGDDLPIYLGPVELSVLGALGAETEAVPLDWYRPRALPGWPISWSPDGRYLAWLKGDRLVLFATE